MRALTDVTNEDGEGIEELCSFCHPKFANTL